ncbi:hypothetical protein PEBR_30421 [Penicillium brasilianum]|uniref:Uncharacterized protein n=1 Tax=Penicillium brasilianum TaxID=104259 RepID=A0A1S9RGD3_PENBI|nr:hypothetical protein PEBR_30421 [Penicillium brasilianum]
MKAQTIFGALLPVLLTANAASSDESMKTVSFGGAELRNLADVIRSHGLADKLAANQDINCTVAYTLALSAGPPYTLSLTSLDLSGCIYTGP